MRGIEDLLVAFLPLVFVAAVGLFLDPIDGRPAYRSCAARTWQHLDHELAKRLGRPGAAILQSLVSGSCHGWLVFWQMSTAPEWLPPELYSVGRSLADWSVCAFSLILAFWLVTGVQLAYRRIQKQSR